MGGPCTHSRHVRLRYLWLRPPLPNFAWLMAQPEGQTGEPLSYQFQFVVCAHVTDNRTQVFDVAMKNARTIETCVDRLSLIGSLTSGF
jgi:hypothetical protein